MKYLITSNSDDQMVQIPLPHVSEWESVEESGYLAFDEAGIVVRNEDEDTWLYVKDWDDSTVVPEPEADLDGTYWETEDNLQVPLNSSDTSETASTYWSLS